MKIVIISDVHNNILNLEKVLSYCKKNKIKKIICCGDLASKETLDFLCDNFVGKIYYTFGNMDEGQLEIELLQGEEPNTFNKNKVVKNKIVFYKNAEVFQDFGEVKIENKKIAFVHFPDIAEKLCQSGKYKFVFYGHTHKPWEELNGGCKMLNPGNVANQIYRPTFAVWDINKNNFKLIEINKIKE